MAITLAATDPVMESPMQITRLPITQIRPYWRNPRKNEDTVQAIKRSIEHYGFNQPLVVDANFVIIAGHARYKALYKLGWTDVPCIVVDMPEDKAKEYRIADNKTAELSSWDMPDLVAELRALPDIGDLQIFFGSVDLGKLLYDVSTPVNQVEDEDIFKASANKKDFAEQASPHNDSKNMVDIACPHCGHEFYIHTDVVGGKPFETAPKG